MTGELHLSAAELRAARDLWDDVADRCTVAGHRLEDMAVGPADSLGARALEDFRSTWGGVLTWLRTEATAAAEAVDEVWRLAYLADGASAEGIERLMPAGEGT